MENDNILGGFSALFDTLSPNEDIKLKGVEVIEDKNDASNDTRPIELTEEESNYNDPIPGHEDDEDNKEDVSEPASKAKKEIPKEDTEAIEEEVDETETEQVTAFFDAIAEQVGWDDITSEEKPKSVEDFVAYMKSAVEESSKPKYANDDIAAIDEYVRSGGNLSDYFAKTSSDVDYDSLDMEDENIQKSLVRDFLLEKGFSDVQIKRKIEKYEDADLLEDEATDAIEFLKESKEQKKKALLDEQRTAYDNNMQEQQNFYNNVVDQIEALSDVRGIKIPKEDKSGLRDFIFKVESDGRTGYQKKYSSSPKNLIESAYFTWKGDKLVEQAKRSGETSATERLKNTLKTNKVNGSKQKINNGSATPLWSIASQQLLRRPQ